MVGNGVQLTGENEPVGLSHLDLNQAQGGAVQALPGSGPAGSVPPTSIIKVWLDPAV